MSRTNEKQNTLFYLTIMLLIVLPLVGWYTYQQVSGNTQIAKTITTNADLEDGLVGHWTFDGPDTDWSSTTAEVLDRSSNGNNGNTINFGSEAASLGKIGQALNFNGSNHYLTANAVANDIGPLPYTVSAWVRPNDTLRGALWGFHSGGVNRNIVLWAQDGTPHFSQFAENRGYIETSSTFPDQEWHHVVEVVESDGSGRLYIDGQSEAVLSNSNAGSANQFSIGQEWDGGSATDFFDGSVDDVRVYNRALSAEEVKRLYELGATTKVAKTITTNADLENGLVGHWTFDGTDMDWSSTTAEVLDRSGNNWHGNANSTSGESPRVGKVGQAFFFDGINDIVSNSLVSLSSSAVTVSFWGQPDSSCGTANKHAVVLTDTSTERIEPRFGSSNDWYIRDASSNTMQPDLGAIPDEWAFYTLVIDGSTSTSFVNSVQEDQVTNVSYVAPSFDLLWFGRAVYSADYYCGLLDDVRVYNRALSAAEVKRLYELGATTHINRTITTNADLENGLVGHWTFDGSQNAQIFDRSGSGNHGYLSGVATSSAVTSGKLGQALSFDGSDDRVPITSVTGLPGGGERSISVWFLSNKNSGTQQIVFTRHPQEQFELRNSTIRLAGSGGTIRVDSGVTPKVGDWYHGVYTWDNATSSIYINGKLKGTSALSNGSGSASTVHFGSTNSGSEFWNGKIDDVRIYNRALSPAEVKRLYELGN